ncbi:stage III sporulation protein SpoIIIAB [Bacillota bacterium LX-D]|nr:stage III sporulation protein SpoIIIAB [Bacillota bacterium LX-D]
MLKIIGALLVIIVCSLFGFRIGKYFQLRPIQLRELRSLLNLLETEIVYASTPLPIALEKLAHRCSKPLDTLFLTTREGLLSGYGLTAAEAWEKGVAKIKNVIMLDPEDLSILNDFGMGLGSSDKQEQIKHLELTKEYLKQQEYKAEQKKVQNERLCKTMGFLTGMIIVLIMY